MVSGTFPPRKFGGVTTASYNLAKKLIDSGHEVTVYTSDVGDNRFSRLNVEDTKFINGINVHYFRNISNSLAFRHRLYLPSGMISAIRKDITNFDIIHFHDFRGVPNIIVHHYAKKHRVPYILQAHGSVLPFFQKQLLKKSFDIFFGCRILKDASTVIALNKTEVEQYKIMGVNESKIEIVPNGIDLAEYEDLPKRGKFRKKYGIRSNEKIILYLGRINKIKGIDLLIKAFSELVNELDNVKLIIIGPDDGFLSTLKVQIDGLKINSKILFLGPLYGRDKLEAYIDADVFVNPCADEIFGIVFLEACACGTPVICSSGCGMANVIDGKTGFAVGNDVNQLRESIFKILTDKGLKMCFGEEGKRLVREKFGWNIAAMKMERIYEGVTRTQV